MQAWLGADEVVADKVLELGSYHAIVACVAAGTGIGIVPRSVLRTMRRNAAVAVHPLGAARGASTTSLVWRKGELSRPLAAMKDEIAALRPTSSPRR